MKTKAGSNTFVDWLAIGASKHFSEKLLAGFVGNGTLMSGVAKLAGATVLGKYLPRQVADGIAIDGSEDIVFSVFGGNALGGMFGSAGGGGVTYI